MAEKPEHVGEASEQAWNIQGFWHICWCALITFLKQMKVKYVTILLTSISWVWILLDMRLEALFAVLLKIMLWHGATGCGVRLQSSLCNVVPPGVQFHCSLLCCNVVPPGVQFHCSLLCCNVVPPGVQFNCSLLCCNVTPPGVQFNCSLLCCNVVPPGVQFNCSLLCCNVVQFMLIVQDMLGNISCTFSMNITH